jgi:excisionase family DNA binding protein
MGLGELKLEIDPVRSAHGMAGNCLINDAFKGEMKPVTTTTPVYEGLKSAGTQNAKESLITKKEAANRLAISVRTLDRLADRGLVEKIYIGGSVRIREREVDSIVECGT